MTVAKILRSKGNDEVLTVPPGSKVLDAVKILSERRIGGLVVSGDGRKALGIVSERDIVREIGRRGDEVLSEAVDDIMTTKLVTCALDDRVESVLQAMTDGRFRHMPVIENGEMVGIITIGDVVKYRLSELAMEKDALEGMIMGF